MHLQRPAQVPLRGASHHTDLHPACQAFSPKAVCESAAKINSPTATSFPKRALAQPRILWRQEMVFWASKVQPHRPKLNSESRPGHAWVEQIHTKADALGTPARTLPPTTATTLLKQVPKAPVSQRVWEGTVSVLFHNISDGSLSGSRPPCQVRHPRN